MADGSAGLGRAVKLHQVRCVVAAAQQGSFRGAAGVLHVQQSSVSRCVRELEDHLGAPLFERGAGGVALTAVGVRFLEDAERALDHLGRAAEIAGAVGREARRVLRIGAAPIPGSGFLPEALQAVTSVPPRCEIRLREASSAENLAAIRAGALDLAVVLAAPPLIAGAEILPLWRETLVWAFPAGERRADRSPASWQEVGPEGLILPTGEIGDLIVQRLANVFGRAFPGASCRAGPETALRLAAMRQGAAIVPAGASILSPGGLCLRPISDDGVLASAVRLTRNDKPALRRLMRRLGEMAATHERGRSVEPVAAAESSAASSLQRPLPERCVVASPAQSTGSRQAQPLTAGGWFQSAAE